MFWNCHVILNRFFSTTLCLLWWCANKYVTTFIKKSRGNSPSLRPAQEKNWSRKFFYRNKYLITVLNNQIKCCLIVYKIIFSSKFSIISEKLWGRRRWGNLANAKRFAFTASAIKIIRNLMNLSFFQYNISILFFTYAINTINIQNTNVKNILFPMKILTSLKIPT